MIIKKVEQMKKVFYYPIPFILIPVALFSCECLDNTSTIPTFSVLIIFSILLSIVIGTPQVFFLAEFLCKRLKAVL